MKDGQILVETKDGTILDTPYPGYEQRKDWFVTDGRRSWPKIQHAIDAGCAIRRAGWNEKGMFAFQRPANELPQDVVAKLNPISGDVRDFLVSQGRPILFTQYYCLWTAQGTVANGWMPNGIDLHAEDWEIVADLK